MKQAAARSDYLDWLAQALEAERGMTPLPDGDVVVGYATGYDAADVAPFVRSLRAVFDGPVALVVDTDAELREFLAQNDVTAVDAPTWRGWAPHPVMQRFVAFAGLLGDRPGAALACAIMGFPLMVRAMRLSIEAVDRRLEAAAGTLDTVGESAIVEVGNIAGSSFVSS